MAHVCWWNVNSSDTEEEEQIILEEMIPEEEEQVVTEDEEQIIPEDQECHMQKNLENDIHSSQSMYLFKCKRILIMHLLLYLRQ